MTLSKKALSRILTSDNYLVLYNGMTVSLVDRGDGIEIRTGSGYTYPLTDEVELRDGENQTVAFSIRDTEFEIIAVKNIRVSDLIA